MIDIQHHAFFTQVIEELLADQTLSLEDRILVACGGDTDFKVLQKLGFKNVTISNVDENEDGSMDTRFAPFDWRSEDTESMTLPDGSYDFVLVHSGLHHLRCPPKGITEMYRVASKGIIGFEPHRSWFTSLGVKLGFGQEFETAAVYYSSMIQGGVANTCVPNYVFRFNRREILETIQTHDPVKRPFGRFWYATRVPERWSKNKDNPSFKPALLCGSLLKFLGKHVPVFANNLAFYIQKTNGSDELFPWLAREQDDIVANRSHLERQFKKDG